MQACTITDTITIADQPDEADLRSLKDQGYVGVVNLRQDGEPEQPLSTADEGDLVRRSGLEYLHQGVGGAPLGPEGVGAVCDFLDGLTPKGKVLVHCRKGGRAAALVLLHQARANGWPADEALLRGEDMGLRVDGNLRLMVQQYLNEH